MLIVSAATADVANNSARKRKICITYVSVRIEGQVVNGNNKYKDYYKLTISISLLETLKKLNCTTGLKLILN